MTTQKSENWKHWVAEKDERTCKRCADKHGTIYPISRPMPIKPFLHPFCRCLILRMTDILSGDATMNGSMGADWFLVHFKRLPDYYISRDEAKSLGWNKKNGNLSDVAPGKMLYGGVYRNDDKKLPSEAGRIWYEADINYMGGYRNDGRILFSNDGLAFVTYDHYEIFYEIVDEIAGEI